MRDVVVIGGGLSGLAAAYELEKTGLSYTIIEVKPRLGGGIASERVGEFLIDRGDLFSLEPRNAPFITELALEDEVFIARVDEEGEWLAFQHGTQTLIDRLAQPLRGGMMLRMAVSTLGTFDFVRHSARHFSICMENGMLLDAGALVVALPARYAERVFHTLKPEISYHLLDYRYDHIARLSLGYRLADVPHIPQEPPPDYPLTYIHALDHTRAPDRVPVGHVLIQIGVRYEPDKGLSPDIVGEVAALLGFPLNPVMEDVAVWGEADPLMWLSDDHAATMQAIHYLLPEGVALAGSDYVVTHDHRPTLQERYAQGKAAAHRVAAWLGQSR